MEKPENGLKPYQMPPSPLGRNLRPISHKSGVRREIMSTSSWSSMPSRRSQRRISYNLIRGSISSIRTCLLR